MKRSGQNGEVTFEPCHYALALGLAHARPGRDLDPCSATADAGFPFETTGANAWRGKFCFPGHEYFPGHGSLEVLESQGFKKSVITYDTADVFK